MKSLTRKKAATIVLLSLCLGTILVFGWHKIFIQAEEKITASQLVGEIQSGWVLGNTLDSTSSKHVHDVTGTETLWNNPETTAEMIQMVADAGFDAIRIPVTYYDNSDEDGNIDEEWLDRVEEVVNYVLDCGLYCIIDVHHDTGTGTLTWISAEASEYEESSYILQKLWKQIAERFKDYDQRLIFEGFNEIIDRSGNWDSTTEECYEVTNRLNQLFVDTVRATGGNNADRVLIVNLYSATPSADNIDNFVVPDDTAEDRIIVGFHTYSLSETNLEAVFSRVNEAFISKGIPVILGEFGSKSTSGSLTERISIAQQVVDLASELNIPYFWWDDGGTAEKSVSVTNYALFNRNSLSWYFPQLVEVLTGTNPGSDEGDGTVSGPQLADGITQVSSIDIGNYRGMFETDILMSQNDEYEITFSLWNTTSYGYPLNVVCGSKNCFVVRQETTNLITVYGYQRFTATTVTAGEKYTVSQIGTSIYVNGTLIKKMPSQTFSDGTVTIGSAIMSFYGMTITRDGEVIHNLVPAVDSATFPCIYDTVTGNVYYSSSQGYVTFTALEDWEDKDESSSETDNSEDENGSGESGDSTDTEEDSENEESGDSSDTGENSDSEGSSGSTDTDKGSGNENLEEGLTLLSSIEIEKTSAKFETDISMGLDDDYEVTFSLTGTGNYGYIINVLSGKRTCYMVRQETTNLITAYGYQRFTAGTVVADTKYTVSQSGQSVYLNGELIKTPPLQDFSEGTLTIGECKMSFYGMIITSDGEIVHNLLPVLDSDNTPCIYDTVTGTLYYSSNQSYISYTMPEDTGESGDTGDNGDTEDTGDTEEGGDSGSTGDTGEETPDAEDSGDDTPATGGSDVADGVTLVKSIDISKTTGKFVTDISMGLSDGYEVTFSLSGTTNYGYVINVLSGKRTCYMVRQETTNLITAYGYQKFTAGTVYAGNIYTVSQSGQSVYLNGSLVRTPPLQDFSEGILTIGECKMSFYGMVITRNGETVHNLVPALDSNGVAGIYDMITETFYYSSDQNYISYTEK